MTDRSDLRLVWCAECGHSPARHDGEQGCFQCGCPTFVAADHAIYQGITWLGDTLLSICPVCGAVVANRAQHTAWHRDYCQGPIPAGSGPPAGLPQHVTDV